MSNSSKTDILLERDKLPTIAQASTVITKILFKTATWTSLALLGHQKKIKKKDFKIFKQIFAGILYFFSYSFF